MCIIRMQNEKKVVFREETGENISCFREKVEKTFLFFVILIKKTFARIDFVKRNILSLYEKNLAKYDNENREKASVVYNMLPEQLGNLVAQMLRASVHSLYFHEYLYKPEGYICLSE